MATVIACVDRAMRAFGGAATYWLTDNERTVTIDHVAGVPVRHPEMVAVGGHYGITVATCVPADPESKGGSEATVRVAEADLVPTDANLRGDYTSWAELVDACEAWMAEVNGREHRVTRRAPVEMLTEEQQRLHRLPEAPYTAVFGETRRVSPSATVSFGAVTYSVPHTLADETVSRRLRCVLALQCAGSGVGVFAHVDCLDPLWDLVDAAVVGEGGDDGAGAWGSGVWPGGPAVGDDDDGVGFGVGGGCDAGGHVGSACAFEGDLVGVVYVLVGVDLGVHCEDPDAVAGHDAGDDGADLCEGLVEFVL